MVEVGGCDAHAFTPKYVSLNICLYFQQSILQLSFTPWQGKVLLHPHHELRYLSQPPAAAL